jgi:hypothetical protein
MAQAVRKRIAEMAVLKTIGFTGCCVLSLILSESVVLLPLGGIVGLVLAAVAVVAVRAKLGHALPMPDVVASAFRRGSGKTSTAVRLTDARAFDAFKTGLASDPRIKVDVQTTQQYYNRPSETSRASPVFSVQRSARS